MRASTSWSMPFPVCLRPLNPGGRRLNASERMSRAVTSCPSASSIVARVAPTRPQPMITIFIAYLLSHRLSEEYHLTGRIFDDVLRRRSDLELAQRTLVADAHDDRVDLSVGGLVHDGVAAVSRLQQLARYLVVHGAGDTLGLSEDILAGTCFGGHFGVQRQIPRDLDHVYGIDGALVPFGEMTAQRERIEPRPPAVNRHKHVFDPQ